MSPHEKMRAIIASYPLADFGGVSGPVMPLPGWVEAGGSLAGNDISSSFESCCSFCLLDFRSCLVISPPSAPDESKSLSAGNGQIVANSPTHRRHIACRKGADQERDERPQRDIDTRLARRVSRGLRGVERLLLCAFGLRHDVRNAFFR